MGRRGSWFSAIKRVFVPSSKDKSTDASEKKSAKEKKKSRGILRHGESKSFIPLFREPSSIEKILGEADEQKLFLRPPVSSEQAQTPTVLPARPTSPRIASPKAASPPHAGSSRPSPPIIASSWPSLPGVASQRVSSPRTASPKVSSPKASSPRVTQQHKEINYTYRPEPTLRHRHLSATKIQSAYRGYIARRSYRALRGLVRLQGVIRGQNVQRQTMNAMKQMQLLVKVQTQIQSRRIQMLENQALQRQAYKNDKEVESTLSKWTSNQLIDVQHEDWDDSMLTKEEIEARLHRKVEAIVKRERAMAYAYSHQLWKPHCTVQSADVRSSGFPWWWNWLERQLVPTNPSESERPTKNVHLTPPRPMSEQKPSPRVQTSSFKPQHYGYDNHEALTPRSSKSTATIRMKQMHTPSRTPPANSSSLLMKYSKPRVGGVHSRYDVPMKDDESLTSCPPFSVPSYMQPTVSAKAKVRASSNPKDRILGTPGNDSKRRFSFPLTPNIASFRWNKGSSRDSTSQRVLEKHTQQSVGEVSVDSAVSMPATVGRKPFNRFV